MIFVPVMVALPESGVVIINGLGMLVHVLPARSVAMTYHV